ncbi:MAG: hypothetical protein AAGF25_13005 [Pseudomonadota bacterium]
MTQFRLDHADLDVMIAGTEILNCGYLIAVLAEHLSRFRRSIAGKAEKPLVAIGMDQGAKSLQIAGTKKI